MSNNEKTNDIAYNMSSVLNNGVSIYDLEFTLLASYGAWGTNKREDLKTAMLLRKWMYRNVSDTDLLEFQEGSLYTEMIIPLYHENNPLGFICLFNEKGKKLDLGKLNLCLPAAIKYLNENQSQSIEAAHNLRSVIEDVLKGSITDQETIKKKLAAARFLNKKNKCFLFIETFKSEEKHPAPRLMESLKGLWDISYLFVIQSNIVMLLLSDDELLDEKRLTKLTDLLAKHGVYGGFSEVFEDIDKYLGFHLSRAICASKAADRLSMHERFSNYENVIPMALLYSEQMPYGIRKCCDPRFMRMLDEDKENNSEYTRTLLTLWYYAFNREKASEHLHIHKNSLGYRINHAEEKYNIDVYDPRIIMSFITTADVLRSFGEMDYLL